MPIRFSATGENPMSRLSRLGGGLPLPAASSSAWLRSLAALLLVSAASWAQAQTIVPNPYLNTQLAPWTAFVSAAPDPAGSGTAPSWTATPDWQNNPASGSAQVNFNTAPLATDAILAINAVSGIAQCVDFAAPTSVTFFNYSMAFRAPPALVTDGSLAATVEVRLFSGAGCNGFLSGGSQGQVLSAAQVTNGTWYTLGDTSFEPLDSPVMAASAQVRGYLRQTGSTTQTAYPINFDQFVLVLNSTTPVSLMHFDVN
jgi:hypothetical protein